MNLRNWLFLAVVVVVLAIAFSLYYASKQEKIRVYIGSVQKLRTEKDLFLATAPDSPFGPNNHFGNLKYYPVNPAFRVIGQVVILDDTVPRYMAMTKEKPSRFVRQGYVDFKLEGLSCRLYLYQQPTDDEHPEHLFIPFTDLTNGKSTYAGGRYLDVKMNPEQRTIDMDFNLAYNPYCVYNSNYSCPIPPSKNNLNLEVLAAEKILKSK